MLLARLLILFALSSSSWVAFASCSGWLSPKTVDQFNGIRLELLLPHDQTSYYTVAEVTSLKALVARENAIPVSATQEVIQELFKEAVSPKNQLRAALNFLLNLETKTQINLAINFEAFAIEIMKRSQNDWQAYRYFGKDGSIAYVGLAGHGLAIKKNGEIYLGTIYQEQLRTDAQWIPKYTDLKKITLENKP